jgi:hypothetical protein
MFVQPNTYLRILRGYSYTYGDRKMASEDTAFLIDSKSIGMALDKGFVGIGTSTPSVKLDVDGAPGEALLRLRVSKTPTSSADSSGDVGSFAWDDNYVYVKTSKGWRRAALGAW